MIFTIDHNNFNVRDLQKSIAFYQDALGMHIVREKEAEDGSFRLVFLSDASGLRSVELTWLRDRDTDYNLGDNEFHLCCAVDDYEQAHALHERMGCICYENHAMGLYFISDPDGYWIEIIPSP